MGIMKLKLKQEAFIREYLIDFNGSAAAIRAGYSARSSRSTSSELLTNPNIKQAVEERIASKEEVLIGLTDIVRGNISDLMSITTSGFMLQLTVTDPITGEIKINPKTKLIKKIRQKTTTYLSKKEDAEDREVIETEIELYSAHDALRDMGKVHALFTDKIKVEAGWRSEIIGLLNSGTVTKQDVIDEVGNDLAVELFKEAGIEIE